MDRTTQPLSVKRAVVEFHNFASLGEPERVLAAYAAKNRDRGAFIERRRDFIGELSPFLELGANAGHTSYLLENEFGASGFALDISADALRHGAALQGLWHYSRAPVRVAGDAAGLPFRDGSIRFLLAYQTLNLLDLERVFLEIQRVLAPGGVFLFAEEPIWRLLSLRIYRCAHYDQMKPWERKLFDWGLLGYLVRDVIGARQEESFGIRQNHNIRLSDWRRLVTKHFAAHEFEIYVPERGWAERWVKALAARFTPGRSLERAARLLGGTLAAVCRKAGSPPAPIPFDPFERFLRCPDCSSGLGRDAEDALTCAACGFRAPNEGGVYNLLPSSERAELYPGERGDILDMSQPNHARHLVEGWHDLEGVFGNKYRWIGARATARLWRVGSGPQRLRVRGYAPKEAFARGEPVRIAAAVNGVNAGELKPDRPGLFVLEADVPDADEYLVEISAAPIWRAPGDARDLTVNLGMLRLAPRR